MASSAAPTFFPPVRHVQGERTYLDGGMWANSPTLLAVLIAHTYLGKRFEDIRVLSVGTGHFPEGRLPRQLSRLRPLSVDTLRTLPEILLASQASFADHHAERLVGSHHFIKADVQLRESIALDDFKSALSILPALAEEEAQKLASKIRVSFPSDARNGGQAHVFPPKFTPPKALLEEMIPAAGLTAFYPSRDFYRKYREATSVDAYVATAMRSVVMVSINLMTGIPIDGLCETLIDKCKRNADFTAVVSLIDPDKAYLMEALSPVLDMAPSDLSRSIVESLVRLTKARNKLRKEDHARFEIRVHNTIPMGSAILLDHNEPFGRIQIESKIYKTPPRLSFAFEVVQTGEQGFYQSLARGYDDLVKDGREWNGDCNRSTVESIV